MTNSILNSTKKILGIAAEYKAFDLDIITHINSVFATLQQLGVGPVEGFMIDDEFPEVGRLLGRQHSAQPGEDLRLHADEACLRPRPTLSGSRR